MEIPAGFFSVICTWKCFKRWTNNYFGSGRKSKYHSDTYSNYSGDCFLMFLWFSD
uniref:Uncharacterized protein n=1 Tax=Octopus bimaculoides TaxID=37653 RepID=A0A0L8IDU2_OCTBM